MKKESASIVRKKKIPRARSEWEERFALQLRLHKIEYLREFQFAAPRKWRADFYIPVFEIARGILVEIEGGIWNGRHTRGQGYIADCEKYNNAVILGYKVLRGTPEHVKSGKLLEWLKLLL